MVEAAKQIWQAGVAAASPGPGVAAVLQGRGPVMVVGAGKASVSMAKAAEQALADRLVGGLVITKHGHGKPLRSIVVEEAGHPIPDEQGVGATQRLVDMLSNHHGDVAVLLSGGASSLMCLPIDGVSLDLLQTTTRLLLNGGHDIARINAVRRRLSQVAGGGLLRWIHGHTIALGLSDVPSGRWDLLGSGPCELDALEPPGFDGLGLPDEILEALQTHKPGQKTHQHQHSIERHWVGDNASAVAGAHAMAHRLGLACVTSTLVGPVEDAAGAFVEQLRDCANGTCLIAGGETTVDVQGKGLGGRNQHFALLAASRIAEEPHICVLAGGTDGTDGPTDAAGAWVDGNTAKRGAARDRDLYQALAAHDAYRFFEGLPEHLITGPTGTNVADLVVGVKG